jgi:hypothetical protein
MTVESAGDRITVAAWGLKLEGGVRDGSLELKRAGKVGPPVTMSGTVERDGVVGDFSIEDPTSRSPYETIIRGLRSGEGPG